MGDGDRDMRLVQLIEVVQTTDGQLLVLWDLQARRQIHLDMTERDDGLEIGSIFSFSPGATTVLSSIGADLLPAGAMPILEPPLRLTV